MKVGFNKNWLLLTIILESTQLVQGAKYVNMQIITDSSGFVQNVNMDTLNLNSSITLTPGDYKNSIKQMVTTVGLIKDNATQASPLAWFNLAPQGGFTFNYSTTGNYDNSINKIKDLNLKQKIHIAHTEYKNYLDTINKTLGVNVTSNMPGDITLKNNPYSAPARAMYKEVKKLAEVVGITLPDEDETWWPCKYITTRNVVGGLSLVALIAAGFAYKYSNLTPMQITGTGIKACGTGVRLTGAGIGTVGSSVKALGSGVTTIGTGIESAGTWIKTPAAPKISATP